jgi:hypothetical protein
VASGIEIAFTISLGGGEWFWVVTQAVGFSLGGQLFSLSSLSGGFVFRSTVAAQQLG